MESRSFVPMRSNEQRAGQFIKTGSFQGLCNQQGDSTYFTEEQQNRDNDGRIHHANQQIIWNIFQNNQGYMCNGERRFFNQLGKPYSTTSSSNTTALMHNQESQKGSCSNSTDHSTEIARPTIIQKTSKNYRIDDQTGLLRATIDSWIQYEEETMVFPTRRNLHTQELIKVKNDELKSKTLKIVQKIDVFKVDTQGELNPEGVMQPGEKMFWFLQENHGQNPGVFQRIAETWHEQ
ncbi:MAG: hypothetical protein EZS28_001834 [Streblomastix strix]|uniref:Uncharacterized protein n=1 Tax=Streblomastix strix TaxID=222440 RepID=A0A5J4X7N6_9EUKA|nr:MAG: hypothetical protein EZS28_001834 [Streblomastix strix]